MTAAIVETLAKEFSVKNEHAQRVFDLLQGGFRAPYIARYRRAEIGSFNDGTIRRFARRLKHLEELERRRASLLRSLEEQHKSEEGVADEKAAVKGDASLEALRTCMDRFELEDLFLPHRRPEPEVQLAIDRGLGALADILVEPPEGGSDDGPDAPTVETPETREDNEPVAETAEVSTEVAEASAPEEKDAAEPVASAEVHVTESPAAEGEAAEAAEATEAPAVEAGNDKEGTHEVVAAKKQPPAQKPSEEKGAPPQAHLEFSPELARVCQDFVNTDRGIHTDMQALEGAIRILSDRLGRNPQLRSYLRRMLRKHGRLTVRALVDEAKLGRNRSLLKINTPLRQLQGHRLLALRQAHAQRLLTTSIQIDESLVLPKVKAALGKRLRPAFKSVAEVVSEQALRQRLLPMIEDDVRNELRERADEEAIRFLAQHLRQVLLAPPGGPRSVAGVHVDAKGDWCMVILDGRGNPVREEIKIEASSLSPGDLAKRLGEELRASGTRALAMGHGKNSRDGVHKLREAIGLLSADACVFLVNDAGVASYANSELARHELSQLSVPAREAVSVGRRFQDPLNELLKVEPRHLGLGREQSVVGKANLRRVLSDTIESCTAHVGCDLNTAPLSFLRHVPGLNFDLAMKLVRRREERPFTTREELRTEGLLDDVAWTNSIGFLRVAEAAEPLDRTSIHPEMYDLARRVILKTGGSVEETLGQREATRGLRRADFEVDEGTWRDLVREISFPGRDPRPRLFFPQLLAFDVDPKTLEKGQVVEGIVSNVASFGAFVDLGIPRDGMIHISEISDRYVRDARAMLSIGQILRARVLDGNGQRVELSLKNIPDARGGARRGRGRPERGESRGRGARRGPEREEIWPDHQPLMRAARTRRDGLAGAAPQKERRGGGGRGQGAGSKGGRGGGRPGGGRPGGGRPGGGRRRGGEEGFDAEAIRKVKDSSGSAYNPFATFFKKDKEDEPGEETRATGENA